MCAPVRLSELCAAPLAALALRATHSRARAFAILLSAASLVPDTAITTARAQGVGPRGSGATAVTTQQLVRPVGTTVELTGRPVDVCVGPANPDGSFDVLAKDNRGVVVFRAANPDAPPPAHTLQLTQEIPFPNNRGGSMTGIAVNRAATHAYATDAANGLVELTRDPAGMWSVSRVIETPGPGGSGKSFPCGIALADTHTAYVCLSRNNSLAQVDLLSGTVVREIPVGVSPFAVKLSADSRFAYVSVWGGRRPRDGEPTARSAGTDALIDARGVAASGGLSIVDLHAARETAFVETGLSASAVLVTRRGERELVLVANANADTVTVIEPDPSGTARVVEQIIVKPDPALPFGSMPNALCEITVDAQPRVLVSCAGNNALAVLRLADAAERPSEIEGWVGTGWYPGGIATLPDSADVLVANIKGVGSRTPRDDAAFNSHRHRGSLQRFRLQPGDELRAMTRRVLDDARVPQTLAAIARAQDADGAAPVPPAPVPASPGQPSVIEHVFYIIKENRTYDQVFGDFASGPNPKGRGRPDLCVYGRDITPNHHALAEQFVLLDNYYCNGVLSADGHSWATEGNTTPYLERSFGGFTRSYTFGDDPLTYSSSGFIWDHVLAAGRSFRNYGEFNDTAIIAPEGHSRSWIDVWRDRESSPASLADRKYRFRQSIGIDNLRRYSHPECPGWNMDIPDQVRADFFLEEFAAFERDANLPNFVVIHLPQNHTMGLTEGGPTPRACVADNDLALGRIVEAISNSRFWEKSAIFVIEDDPQDGWDHIDGHRSLCLVISPWARRAQVISEFYSQTSVIHTIHRIFAISAQNQLSGAARVMSACFLPPGAKPDLTPFRALPALVPLDELTPRKQAAEPCLRRMYDLTSVQDFSKPDAADEDEFNRVLWAAAKGCDADYPASLAGAHASGLASVGLRPDPARGIDEDPAHHPANDD